MRRALLALATTGLLVTAAGCGGDDGGADDPAASSGPPSEEAQLAFARCMRANGIDMPDPDTSGGGVRVRIKRDTPPQVVERATKTCREKTGGGPPELTAEQQQELRDQALAFARCMRSNGVDLPDPQVSGGGGVLVRSRRGSFRPDSPAFRRAEKACRDLRPGLRREGAGDGPEVSVEGR